MGRHLSELVECITGLMEPTSGRIELSGEDVTEVPARRRREGGLSHVPEDRNERGLIGPYSAPMNAILGDYHREPYSGGFGFLRHDRIQEHARELIREYDVRPASSDVLAAAYSGGNAQKLVVARELERDPSVVVMAQPTRGVDIGAIEFIHQEIVRARDMGLAVLLVSPDLNEILSLADRIVVMSEGRIMGEMAQDEATAEKCGLLMAGSRLGDESEARLAYRNREPRVRERAQTPIAPFPSAPIMRCLWQQIHPARAHWFGVAFSVPQSQR